MDDVALCLEVDQGSDGLDTDVKQRLYLVWRDGPVTEAVSQRAAVMPLRDEVERTFTGTDADQPINVVVPQADHRTDLYMTPLHGHDVSMVPSGLPL